MIIITHNKDLDGHASGAICKLKYPDAKLIGWDYKDPIPDFEQFRGQDVIMIDVSFPLEKLLDLANISRLTLIDHHISLYKEVQKWINHDYAEIHTADMRALTFNYIYEDRAAACEIGWKYLFPDVPVPYAITLLGRYDTWRQEEGNWEGETLPFQYAMRINVVSADSFPEIFLTPGVFAEDLIKKEVHVGKSVLKYQEQQDMLACQRSAFEATVGGLRAVCLNTRAFSSNTMKSVYNPEKHDIMVGFEYTGTKWSVSLRSAKPDVDVSVIAKSRGGGGHKAAAGFECNTFEDIFK